MRAIVALLCIGCAGIEPPQPDEVACLWERVEEFRAPDDRCMRYIGEAHLKMAPDACLAADAPDCVILQPGESSWVFTDTYGAADGKFTRGSCETLTCP